MSEKYAGKALAARRTARAVKRVSVRGVSVKDIVAKAVARKAAMPNGCYAFSVSELEMLLTLVLVKSRSGRK